jgi:hypothetical protein
MKIILHIFIILLAFNSQLFGQNDLREKVRKLKEISDMPYICEGAINLPGCGQSAFWDIVKERDAAIPILLEFLDDTTSAIATVPNFGGNWTVGDIAYTALEEIIDGIPTFKLLGVKFDSKGCGYCVYWFHLRASYKNRQVFKANVIKWYNKNQGRLIWVQSNQTLTCDCRFNHPNGGHYELKH